MKRASVVFVVAAVAAGLVSVGCQSKDKDKDRAKASDALHGAGAGNAEATCLPEVGDGAMAARYVSVSSEGGSAQPSERQWSYLRDARRVAFDHSERGLVELWSKTGASDLSFERWFPEFKRSITYTSGDLKSLGRNAVWETVSAIVPPAVREKLAPAGQATVRCREATMYRGVVDGVSYELTWLEEAGVPARFAVARDGETHVLELEGLEVGAPVVERLDRGRSYAAMDFADIGDNESDPFVARMIAQGFVEHPTNHPGHGSGAHDHE